MATSNMFFNVADGYPLGLDYNPNLGELLDLSGGFEVVSQSPVQQVITLNSNGLTVIINGIGLEYDVENNGAAGVITSIQVYNEAGRLVNQLITTEDFEAFAIKSAEVGGDANELNLYLMRGNDTVNGSSGDDDIRGHDGNDALSGGAGGDFLVGGRGADTYDGGTNVGTRDTLAYDDDPATTKGVTIRANGTAVDQYGNNETFTGIEHFVGTQFRDVMTGGNANEVFSGLGGNDAINGGGGIDTVNYLRDEFRGSIHGVTVNLTTGRATDGFVGVDTLSNIENVDATNFDDTVTGSAVANVINTFDGNDWVDGAAGNDTINTAEGNDTVFGGLGNDTINTGEGDDTIDTGAGNDVVVAGAGNDRIETGTGTDNVQGGAGNDTYVVHTLLTIVDEGVAGSDGVDTIVSDVSYDLESQAALNRVRGDVENVTLVGTAALNASGNDLDNVLTGNAGRNVLLGRSGNDTIAGGAGHDSLDGGTGNDVLDGGDGDDSLVGGSGHDKMTGGAGDDTLQGGDGNDTLDGGSGQNRLEGGFGNDVYNIGAKADGDDAVIDTGGVDTVMSSISRSLEFYASNDAQNIENLTLGGTGNIDGTGSSGNNVLTGNSGNNILLGLAGNDTLIGGGGNDTMDGGTGSDSMQGGDGNDTYIVNGTDTISDTGGIDIVQASTQSIFLTDYSGVENLTLSGSGNYNGTGNAFANTIIGNNGNNVLSGLEGDDALSGGFGIDTLLGGAGKDTLLGGGGNDKLNGGAGSDTLTGGDDADSFVFDQALVKAGYGAQWWTGANWDARDHITDFNAADDTINLSKAVFAALGSAVDASELRVWDGVNFDANDYLVYLQDSGTLLYDSDGAGTAQGFQAVATLDNHASISFADFAII